MKNRIIKFRAWDSRNNRMIDGVGISPTGHEHDYMLSTGSSGTTITANRDESPYILMQFTGLHDKNGKEIYEGDIILSASKVPYAVEFRAGSFMWAGLHLGFDEEDPLYENDRAWGEVIGNIYENANLLTPSIEG